VAGDAAPVGWTGRVGAVVDDVRGGWARCELSIAPGRVAVRLGRPLWLLPSRLRGTTVVHAGAAVPLVWTRWQAPWQRAGLVVFDSEHRVVLPMTRARAERLRTVLAQYGHRVDEIRAGAFDGAGSVAAQLQYRYLVLPVSGAPGPAARRLSGRSARCGPGSAGPGPRVTAPPAGRGAPR
jgi:hypothetical protein